MANEKIFVFSGDERGALRMLVNMEIQRLMKQEPRNETMIEQFRAISEQLRVGRPLS